MKWDADTIRLALRCYVILNVEYFPAQAVCDLAWQVVESGATIVQLRDKGGSDEAYSELARQVLPICREAGVPLVLNDRWHLVQETGVDGVHLGADDGAIDAVRAAVGAEALIGRSIDRPEDCEEGPDYFGLGPIFNTDTKQDTGPVIGLAQLRGWREQIPAPLVAIGGMSAERAPAVIHAGADGIAVVSAVCHAIHPDQACRSLRQAVDKALGLSA